MALDRRPPQQSYLKQAVLLEPIIVNNSWSTIIKEIKRIKKSQASIAPGVANHWQTKLLGPNQVATTTVPTTWKK